MNKDEVKRKVKIVLKNNSEIETIFYPLIEEFFIRLPEKHSLSDTELEERINKLANISFLKFSKCPKKQLGIHNFSVKFDYKYLSVDRSVNFDIKQLYSLLLGNDKKIEEFINLVFHELTHLVQLNLDSSNSIITGLQQNSYTFSRFDNEIINEKHTGIISNEYATIINSELLTKGNLNCRQYYMYEFIQSIARSIYASFGVSDLDLSWLQMKSRNSYEHYIASQIGDDYNNDLIEMEQYLDDLYILIFNRFNTYYPDSSDEEFSIQLKDFIEQINNKTNAIILKRISKLGNNPNLADLAKIIVDKETRDNYLLQFILTYNSELPLHYDINLNNNLLDDYILPYSFKELEDIKHKIQSQTNPIFSYYDNSDLIKTLRQLALEYNGDHLPLLTRINLSILKKIANYKNKLHENELSNSDSSDNKRIQNNNNSFDDSIHADTPIITPPNTNCPDKIVENRINTSPEL